MKVTDNLESWLRKFAGRETEVFDYVPFSSILRLTVEDTDEKEWVVSLSECRHVSFPTGWNITTFILDNADDGYLRIIDHSSGFNITFKECFIIPDDDYPSEE